MNIICNYCNKIYASYSSRSNHIKKYHLTESEVCQKNVKNVKLNVKNMSKNVKNNLTCEKCKKEFNSRQARWAHSKKCVIEVDEVTELRKQMEEMKQQMTNLLKSCKIHPKTLQKINNQLNNNINNTNNGTINNNVIMKFGNVNIKDVLSDKQIMNLLHKPFISVEECVKMIHFNDKLPQYNNIRASARYITNMKDDLVYVYDGTRFTTTTKTDTIYDMITNYTDQIELSFDDNKDKLTEYKIKCVENYLELINSNKEYIDQYNKKYTNFKTYKIGDVKRLIYDKSDPKKFAMVCKGIDV